ncbi:TPA: DNA replication protein [Citrobacter sedlakii]|nr:DNA replication protein [Citrobacter sedlakii]
MGVVKLADYRHNPVQPQEASSMGYVSIHRQFMDSRLYKDSQAVHLWLHLILKANHESTVINTDIGPITVDRGQMLTGRPTLVSETFIPDNKVRSLLRTFEAKGMLNISSMGKKFSLLTIVKYDDFQTKNCPTVVQRLSNDNTSIDAPLSDDCPTVVQRLSINNKYLNNNLLPKGSKCVTASDENNSGKTQRLSCEEVWQALKECVPDARGWNALTPKRRTRIQKFWREVKPIAKQLGDTEPFGMQAFRRYLEYIHVSCRWMFECRPDQKTGKTWQKCNYEFILNSELYAQVREGERDDR